MKTITITKRDRSLVAEWLAGVVLLMERLAEFEPDAGLIELMAALRRLLEELER